MARTCCDWSVLNCLLVLCDEDTQNLPTAVSVYLRDLDKVWIFLGTLYTIKIYKLWPDYMVKVHVDHLCNNRLKAAWHDANYKEYTVHELVRNKLCVTIQQQQEFHSNLDRRTIKELQKWVFSLVVSVLEVLKLFSLVSLSLPDTGINCFCPVHNVSGRYINNPAHQSLCCLSSCRLFTVTYFSLPRRMPYV